MNQTNTLDKDLFSAQEVGTPEFVAKIDDAAANMLEACSEVRVRTTWFSTSAKVDEEEAMEMLKDSDADRKAISISKRLLSSKHEALLIVKEARKSLDEHVKAWTIPMMAIQAAGDAENLTRKDAGIRLIQKADITQFDERFKYLKGILNTAVENLQRKMPEIMAEDKLRLGKLYKEHDYPKDVTKLISIDVNYKPVGVDIDWEKLCPEVYERERANAQQKFSAVVENAAVEFAGRFVKYVKQTMDQLGNRLRLNPCVGKDKLEVMIASGDTEDRKLVSVKDAEILASLKHSDDDEIPEGHVLLQLRLKKDGKGRSTDVWLAAPVTDRQYGMELRPYETSERKKLYASTIDNLKAELEAFMNIGSLLGPYQEIVKDGVDKVKMMLSRGDGELNSERIADQLRDQSYFRNEMKRALEGVVNSVQDQMGESKKIRRKISNKLIGKV